MQYLIWILLNVACIAINFPYANEPLNMVAICANVVAIVVLIKMWVTD